VLRASFDTVEGHRAFAEIQGFTFALLSDVDHEVGAAYEVVRRGEERYARFAERHSYLIDPEGVIRRTYDVSDVESHADGVLQDLHRLVERPSSPAPN
jgi:peroxiredoxin Q/BCP